MSNFDLAIAYVLSKEGGLEENPNDPGGITNHGISLRFLQCIDEDRLKEYGFHSMVDKDTIVNLTIDQAKAIYKGEFWNHAHFDKITSQNNCSYIFDMAVNMGIAPAIKCAQRATWAVMHKYKLIQDDGILGNETLSLINQCGIYLLPAMCSERAGYYRMTILEHPSEKGFIDGWLNRSYTLGGANVHSLIG